MKVNSSGLLVATSILIIALAVGYYFVFFLPNKYKRDREFEKEKIRLEQEFMERQEESKSAQLNECLRNAFSNYQGTWNLNCPEFGGDKKTDGCTLPTWASDPIEKGYKDDQELCVKKFK